MKRFLPVIVGLVFTTMSFGQSITSFVVKPSSPTVNDTIEICWNLQFPSSGCKGSCQWSQAGFNINASALHCLGALSAICTDVDTVILLPPHTAGTYSCTFTLSSGSGGPPCTPGITPNDQRTINFNVSTVTGISSNSGAGIQLFPNPANGFTTLKLDAETSLKNIRITDLSGKQTKCIVESNNSTIQIDTSELPSGIYYVNLEHNGGTTVKKLVVQH